MTVAEMIDLRPVNGTGAPTTHGGWRLGVEILIPSETNALWGTAKWGQAKWSAPIWTTVNTYVRGMEWTRGAEEFDGRPRAGVATITLDNHEYRFSPIDPTNSFQTIVRVGDDYEIVNAYFRPGTVLRIVAHDPDDDTEDGWVPLFTGVVESWPEVRHHVGRESYIDVTAVETISTLARVDENALVALEGNDDTAAERVERLADAADWPFGFLFEDFGAFNDSTEFLLASTDMANNRITELYLTADSVGGVVRTDRSGKLACYGGIKITSGVPELVQCPPQRGPLEHVTLDAAAYPGDEADDHVVVDPEGLTVDNDNTPIVNVAQIGRTGSTPQEAGDPLSIEQMKGRFTFARSDLINKSDTLCAALAETMVANLAYATRRLRSVTVNALRDPRAVAAMLTLDVHSPVTVTVPTSRPGAHIEIESRVDSMTHRATPTSLGGPWNWTCTYGLGLQTVPVVFCSPLNTVAPVATSADPDDYFAELSVTDGTWSANPSATYAYSWRRADTHAELGTGSTYEPTEPDALEGVGVYCRVTATNDLGSAQADSNTVTVPYRPRALVLPGTTGNYVSTPDVAYAPSAITVMARVLLAATYSSPTRPIVAHGASHLSTASWMIEMSFDNRLQVNYSANGTGLGALATGVGSPARGEWLWVALTYEANVSGNRRRRGFTATTPPSWTQILSSTSGAAANLNDSTSPLTIGAWPDGSAAWPGRVAEVVVIPAVVSGAPADPADAIAHWVATEHYAAVTEGEPYVDRCGNEWTLNGSGSTWEEPT